jgi:hypothetical protein
MILMDRIDKCNIYRCRSCKNEVTVDVE